MFASKKEVYSIGR